MRRFAPALAAALLLAPASAMPAGNAVNGEKLHQSCLQCHGTEVYVPPKRKIGSLAALREEVTRWSDYYNPKFTRSEIDDLTAYLNRDFYKFP